MRTFEPNWKREGFGSKEEAMAHVLQCLYDNKKKILSHGLGKPGEKVETSFSYKGRLFTLRGKIGKK